MLDGRVAWSAATLLRALSYPHEDRADDVAEAIAVREGRAILERFLDRYGHRLRLRGHGLAEALEGAASTLTLRSAWDPWAGAVARSLERDDPAPERTAMLAALHLAASGDAGAPWSCVLYDPAPLRFGRWLLPPVELVTLLVDGEDARVAARGAWGELEVTADGGGVPAGAAERLPAVGEPAPLTLLPAAEPGIEFPPPDEGVTVPGRVPPEAAESVAVSLALLGQAAPAYLRWVGWGLRDAVVVPAEPGAPRSGASADWPGLVFLSAPHDPTALAELLVHEATHQYLHLAARVGPVDDGSDQGTYWSPLKGMERPLSRLLAAYHAFGNVALVLWGFVEAGVDQRGRAADRLAALLPALRTTEAHLWQNPALTPAGRALVDPLLTRLSALAG
jgi:HEXXH motif-containing protein